MIKYSISDQTPVTFRNLRRQQVEDKVSKCNNVYTKTKQSASPVPLRLFHHLPASRLRDVIGRRKKKRKERGERERRVPPIPRAERRGEAKRGKEDEDEAAAAALDGGVGARHSSLSERWKAFQPESTLAQLCFLFWGGGCGVACAPAGGGCRQREAERESVGR